MDYIKTAVGMFNAGEVLREYFSHLDVGTEDEKARKRSTIIPMVVTYMFGIEVGLKALIQGQGQKPPRIRDLKRRSGDDVVSQSLASTTANLPGRRTAFLFVPFTGRIPATRPIRTCRHADALHAWFAGLAANGN